ncbi:unnamed protein product [Brassica rapa subsp. trilocularis]
MIENKAIRLENKEEKTIIKGIPALVSESHRHKNKEEKTIRKEISASVLRKPPAQAWEVEATMDFVRHESSILHHVHKVMIFTKTDYFQNSGSAEDFSRMFKLKVFSDAESCQIDLLL